MSLKKRLILVFIVVLSSGVSLFFAYAINAYLIGGRFAVIRDNTESVQKDAETIGVCVQSLENLAGEYFSDTSSAVAQKLNEKSIECNNLIDKSSASLIATSFKEDSKEKIALYTKTILEVATRSQSTQESLKKIQKTLQILALKLRKSNANKEVTDEILNLSLNLSSNLVRGAKFNMDSVGQQNKSLLALAKLDPGASKSLQEIDEVLADLEGVASIWNKTLTQRETQYNARRYEVSILTSKISNLMLQQVLKASSSTLIMFKASVVVGFILIACSILVMAFLFNWILNSWKETMGTLKDMCSKILSGTDSISSIAQMLSTEDTANEKEQDEINVTYRAIGRTLSELAELKESLEHKVEERTKSLIETQTKLNQSERLASLGTMAAGVAHELNNPLQVILFLIEKLEIKFMKDEKVMTTFSQIKDHVRRMSRIIEQLKGLARKDDNSKNSWKKMPLKTIVDNSVFLVNHSINKQKIDVTFDIDPTLTIHCNPIKLESVISNLIKNAAEAFEKIKDNSNKKFSITVKSRFVSNGDLNIDVEDNGEGIPDESKNKIFEPFFTSKDIGKGTGLGLSLCRKFIQEMGGEMSFKSTHTVGTTFTITIPKDYIQKEERLVA